MQDAAIEIGMFKLKPNIALENAIAVYENMIQHFLRQQIGWQAQSLILLEDGTLIDLAWSQNIDTAQLICSLWQESRECLSFLALIEPLSMQFGRVLSATKNHLH